MLTFDPCWMIQCAYYIHGRQSWLTLSYWKDTPPICFKSTSLLILGLLHKQPSFMSFMSKMEDSYACFPIIACIYVLYGSQNPHDPEHHVGFHPFCKYNLFSFEKYFTPNDDVVMYGSSCCHHHLHTSLSGSRTINCTTVLVHKIFPWSWWWNHCVFPAVILIFFKANVDLYSIGTLLLDLGVTRQSCLTAHHENDPQQLFEWHQSDVWRTLWLGNIIRNGVKCPPTMFMVCHTCLISYTSRLKLTFLVYLIVWSQSVAQFG